MDTMIMLLCKYGMQILPVRVSASVRLGNVLSCICKRWNNLSMGSFSISYDLENGCCPLDSEEDFDNMLFLFRNSDRINARIVEGECSSVVTMDSVNNEMEIDTADQLELFCQHRETKFLTDTWVDLIQEIGQEFPGGVKEFRDALAKFSIENGFMYKYVKNDKYRVTANCIVDGCGWHVHAILNRTNGMFHIKEYQQEHNCGSTYRSSKHKRVTSGLVAGEIAGIIEKKPKTTPVDMVNMFTDKYGIDLPYHNAWLAVQKAKGTVYGDYATSFDKLRWYVEAAKVTNPGSVVNLEYNHASNEFSRLFLSFNACMMGFNHCRPILCLDACHLKGRFKGCLLAATGKDANQGLFPLAYAICDAENDANWFWFLGHLRSSLSPRCITFITDRNAGLVKNIPLVFPHCHHAYCLYHLQNNLRDAFPGQFRKGFRKRLVQLFNNCAYAPSLSAFKMCEDEFYKYGGEQAKKFLESLPKDHFCNAFFKGHRYGEMSSSSAESFNNWINEAREMPVLYLVDTLRCKIMKQMAERRDESTRWNSVVCPRMDKKLACFIKTGRSWLVNKSMNGLYEVRSLPAVLVNLEAGTCSCGYWQSTAFLCRHAATVVMKSSGGEGSLGDHIHDLYRVEAFRRTYEEPIYPVVEMEIQDFTQDGERVIKPPRNRRPPGRPKEKRFRSRGEESSTRALKCGRCHKYGRHNQRTCKEPSDT